MAIELVFGTRVNVAEDLIREGTVNPIIDFDGTRYSIEINKGTGMLRWTPFTLSTQLQVGTVTYIVPYAAHNVLAESLLGPSSQNWSNPSTVAQATFPNFPVPLDTGTVTP